MNKKINIKMRKLFEKINNTLADLFLEKLPLGIRINEIISLNEKPEEELKSIISHVISKYAFPIKDIKNFSINNDRRLECEFKIVFKDNSKILVSCEIDYRKFKNDLINIRSIYIYY